MDCCICLSSIKPITDTSSNQKHGLVSHDKKKVKKSMTAPPIPRISLNMDIRLLIIWVFCLLMVVTAISILLLFVYLPPIQTEIYYWFPFEMYYWWVGTPTSVHIPGVGWGCEVLITQLITQMIHACVGTSDLIVRKVKQDIDHW